MTWLRRQDCNYTRYQHLRRPGELLMTQWGDCALQLILYNNIPIAEAAGYPQVRHHCRQAGMNRKLCCMWTHLDLGFQRYGTHRVGDVIEMYLFQMMESASGGDIESATNLFCIGMYALLLQYCPWHAPQ